MLFFRAAREFGAWRAVEWGRAYGSAMALGTCRRWLNCDKCGEIPDLYTDISIIPIREVLMREIYYTTYQFIHGPIPFILPDDTKISFSDR